VSDAGQGLEGKNGLLPTKFRRNRHFPTGCGHILRVGIVPNGDKGLGHSCGFGCRTRDRIAGFGVARWNCRTCIRLGRRESTFSRSGCSKRQRFACGCRVNFAARIAGRE